MAVDVLYIYKLESHLKISARGLLRTRVVFMFILFLYFNLWGCSWFSAGERAERPLAERPRLALLPWGFEVQITKLSAVKTVDKELTPEQEKQQVTQALQEILHETRWLLQSNIAVAQQFTMVSLEEIDAASADLGIQAGQLPTSDQLCSLRTQLRADLVLVGNILDYGKVRWQWLAAGELGDLSAETVVLGLASSWNVPLMLGNVGFELLTSTPLWFGGGYVFGFAFRPVRVEARALETVHGEPVWQDEEAAIWGRGRLKQLSEPDRAKKEIQLYVNLSKAMEEIADSLNEQTFTVSSLRERQNSAQKTGCQ